MGSNLQNVFVYYAKYMIVITWNQCFIGFGFTIAYTFGSISLFYIISLMMY